VKLEKIFRNDLFEAIRGSGLDTGEFDLELGDTEEAEARITHRWSESYFILGGDFGHWVGSYVVGDNQPWPYEAYTWPTVKERVQHWGAKVKQDLETPDLWAELRREREILNRARDEAANTPFTPDEQAEIVEHLREIEEYVRNTYSLSQDQIAVLGVRFDELEAAVGRVGRLDFKGLFLGALFALFLAGVLPPEVVHSILIMALHGLEHVFGGGSGGGPAPELPPAPPVI
jgi:hypothetical protein